MRTTVKIRGTTSEYKIDNLLFGGNMEPTRRTFFSGLAAQMINNRKFFAIHDGKAEGWISGEGVSISYERTKSVCNSYYPIVENAHIKQQSDELAAENGREYELRCWVATTQGATIKVSWGNAWQRDFLLIGSDKPQLLEEVFVAKADGKCEFSLSVEGCAAIYCVSLMPADNIKGMRKDVLDALKECGIKALRFPGGCYAEVYPWKDGLLPSDFRTPIDSTMYNGDFLFRNTYGQDCHEIATDEFMLLCKYIGAEPTLTVPILKADMQNSLDWLEYCNLDENTKYGALRIDRGYSEPYGVRYWFIGNEIYFFGESIATDGNAAGIRERQFITAMKAVDPSIKTIIGMCSSENWNLSSAKQCGDVADMISFHYYLTNEYAENFGKVTVEQAFNVEKIFCDALLKTVNTLSKPVDKAWEISVDEWSYDWGKRGQNLSALVDSIIFHFMLNNSEKYHIKQAFYFHPVNEGIIKVEPNEVKMDIMGEICKLFKNHCGKQLCDVQCEDSGLSVVATTDGDVTVATVINRTTDVADNVTFDVEATPVEQVILIPDEISDKNNQFTINKIEKFSKTVSLPAGSVSLLMFKN